MTWEEREESLVRVRLASRALQRRLCLARLGLVVLRFQREEDLAPAHLLAHVRPHGGHPAGDLGGDHDLLPRPDAGRVLQGDGDVARTARPPS